MLPLRLRVCVCRRCRPPPWCCRDAPRSSARAPPRPACVCVGRRLLELECHSRDGDRGLGGGRGCGGVWIGRGGMELAANAVATAPRFGTTCSNPGGGGGGGGMSRHHRGGPARAAGAAAGVGAMGPAAAGVVHSACCASACGVGDGSTRIFSLAVYIGLCHCFVLSVARRCRL